jgi:DNA-binding beta-propeller fold protein YncE
VAPLVQLPDVAGCVSDAGTGGACTDGVALVGAASPAVSPDGRSVYVASTVSDAVAVFDRDAATGALTQKEGTATPSLIPQLHVSATAWFSADRGSGCQ